MWEKYSLKLKVAGSILGAIFLGAVGSGVWENLLGPLLRSSRDLVLNISSLGINKFRDSVYVSIAKDFHELSSVNVHIALEMFFFVLFIFCSVALIILRRALLDRLGKIQDGQNQREEKKDPSYLLAGKVWRSMSWLAAIVSIYLIFATISFVQGIKYAYINSAVTHFHQLLTISAPYLDTKNRERISSSFAQIKNKNDYQQIIDNLRKVAVENKQQPPDFDIW